MVSSEAGLFSPLSVPVLARLEAPRWEEGSWRDAPAGADRAGFTAGQLVEWDL